MPADFRPESLALGITLIALGVLGTLANLGRLDMLSTVRTWWPAVLVLWGALELARTLAARRNR